MNLPDVFEPSPFLVISRCYGLRKPGMQTRGPPSILGEPSLDMVSIGNGVGQSASAMTTLVTHMACSNDICLSITTAI